MNQASPESLASELARECRGRVRARVLLSDYVYYRVGGPADVFVEPANERDIQNVLLFARSRRLPLTIIGSGTNLLIRDGGLEGICLYLGAGLPGDLEVLDESTGEVRVRVPAHWPKARLLDEALRRGWSGLEFSAGIPGTMGGAVYMNAGTKWGSYGDVIEKVRLLSVGPQPTGGIVEKSNAEMGFRYRGHGESLLDGWTVVVSADIRLRTDKRREDIHALVDEILSYRGSKQPLELPNCGSVFKNPESGPGAGRLIEATGLKGRRVGQAQVSLKHANFILNMGGASASDLEALIEIVQRDVESAKGVLLEREVIILGRQKPGPGQSES